MYIYVPHYHKNYTKTPPKNANIHDKLIGEPHTMASPHEHSLYIEKKLKAEGHYVHRTSDVHLNVDKDTNIESHSVGSYISGNDRKKLHNVYKNITKPSNKVKETKSNNFLKSFTDVNSKDANLMYEDVQQTYYIKKQLNESTRYFKVKADSYQLAEEVVNILLNNNT